MSVLASLGFFRDPEMLGLARTLALRSEHLSWQQWSQVANSLLVLLRRKRILPEERDRALDALAGLPLVVDDEGARLPFGRTSELAAEHGLSVYDAAYLELALRRRLPLATRDDALRKAARDCRLKLLL